MFTNLKNKHKSIFKNIGLGLSCLVLIFSILEHYGFWNSVRCTNTLLHYNSRIQTSYAEVKRIITPNDSEWKCVLSLIQEFSPVNLPSDKKPLVIARFVATQSFKQTIGPENTIAEWTTPSTPLAVLYKPFPGNELKPEDFTIIGSIGDFESWIDKDKSNFNFKAQNYIFGILSLIITFLLF